MTNGKRDGQPGTSDDRTILDPLNAEELRALREARERLQGSKGAARPAAAAAAPAPAARPGPKGEDDDGSAPTRAMPAVGGAFPDAAQGAPRIIADPKPLTPQSARIPGNVGQPPAPQGGAPAAGQQGAQPAQGQPQPGQPGFGEHTLMWMAPVKLPEEQKVDPKRGAAAAAGMTPTAVPQETAGKKALTYVLAAVLALVVVMVGYAIFSDKGSPSVVELVTVPPKASVKINGKPTEVPTPMKATLKPGTHSVEISLAGYKTETFELTVEPGAEPMRKSVDLEPISNPGFLTLSITVQPVAANITLDGKVHSTKKVIKVANIDPKTEHKIAIEAGGYAKIEQTIPAGQLKDSYNFVLQAEKQPE